MGRTPAHGGRGRYHFCVAPLTTYFVTAENIFQYFPVMKWPPPHSPPHPGVANTGALEVDRRRSRLGRGMKEGRVRLAA